MKTNYKLYVLILFAGFLLQSCTTPIGEIKIKKLKKLEMPHIKAVEYCINAFEIIGLTTLIVLASITDI